LVRLHTQLSDEVARNKNEIQAMLTVLFPEFTQVFADPCRATALAVLKQYPSAQEMAAAGVETVARLLQELAPHNYGRPTAERLVQLASHSVSHGVAVAARSMSVKIVCDQLEHTQANMKKLESEIDKLLETDEGVKGLRSVPEFGRKTVAVLRAELGDVTRFQRTDQVVAYAGMDIEVKESGKWKGQAKLSKRGSGRLRRFLYLAAVRCIRRADSAFGAYYHRLLARGMKARDALMAVMRKMLVVAYHLLRTEELYDATKVAAVMLARAPASLPLPSSHHRVPPFATNDRPQPAFCASPPSTHLVLSFHEPAADDSTPQRQNRPGVYSAPPPDTRSAEAARCHAWRAWPVLSTSRSPSPRYPFRHRLPPGPCAESASHPPIPPAAPPPSCVQTQARCAALSPPRPSPAVCRFHSRASSYWLAYARADHRRS